VPRRCGLHAYILLFIGLQVACFLRPRAQTLHGIENVFLLGEKGVAQFLGPVEFVVHRFQRLRKRDQRFHADIPRLTLYRLYRRIALEFGILFDPTRGMHDFQRIGRRHQYLRQHRVWIKGDRGHQCLDFLRLECGSLRLILGGRVDPTHHQQGDERHADCSRQSFSPPIHGRFSQLSTMSDGVRIFVAGFISSLVMGQTVGIVSTF